MAANMFLKVDGATGESDDSNHKAWTEIKSFSWGASQPGGTAMTGTAGRASFNDLQVTAYMDKATPALMKNCASGERVGKLTLDVCKSMGEKKSFCTIVLEKVLVTSAQVVGVDPQDQHERVMMNYGFQGAIVRKSYIDDHGHGAESNVAWDIAKNIPL